VKYLLLVPCLLMACTTLIHAGDDPADETPKKEGPKAEEKKEEPKVAEEAPEFATIDKKAPDFTLKNAKGEEVKLTSFADKTVVIEWVNFDCPYVRKHYDGGAMNTTRKKYTEKGVVWLQVCSSAQGKQGHFTGEALTTRIEKEGCDAASYLIDEDGKVGQKYKARCTPHMFVIDKKGVLRYQGAIDSVKSDKKEDIEGATNYVAAALDELLADKVVSTKETKPYG
jgi:alkyl hydroperoxide reductase subunit AhpC